MVCQTRPYENHRDLPLGGLYVLGLDGLSNPPLRDIAIYRWLVDGIYRWAGRVDCDLPLGGAGFRDYAC
jgi:predicted DCC family thiol-disulfide oxidoreductase YuxK